MDSHSLKVVQENRDYTMFSWSVQATANPIHMKRGQGVWFWDGDDHRWLDFSSQLINLNVGHQHPKMLAAIKNGDKVVTSSGIYGTVSGIDGDTVILKIADQVKIRILRSAIAQVEVEENVS